MAIGGGIDRSWMKPLTTEGSVDLDDSDLKGRIRGCYQGPSLGLNVLDPQPGCEYQIRRLDEDMAVRMEGGQWVKLDDPDGWVMTAMMKRGDGGSQPTPLQGIHTNGEVGLVRFSVDTIRERHEQHERIALAAARGGAEEYVDGATQAEKLAGRGRTTRFRTRDHGHVYEDGQGTPYGQWHPDDGIIPSV